MSDIWNDSSDDRPAIAKIEASPQPGEGGIVSGRELTSFQRFWRWLFPRIETGADLSVEFGRASVAEKEASARRVAEEAAEIAAKREIADAQAGTQRQMEVKQFIENIEAIEKLETSAGRAVAFAKILEKNPDIMEQVEKVELIVSRLSIQRGLMLTQSESEKPSIEVTEEVSD